MCWKLKRILFIGFFVLVMSNISFAQNLIPGLTVELQAESAQLYQADIESEHSGFTGSGYVNFVNQVGSYLEWTVENTEQTMASFTIIFANGGESRSLDILVNNTLVASEAFSTTGAWDNWQSKSLDIYILPGTSTIRLLSSGSEGGPNVDRMNITLFGSSSSGYPGDVNKDSLVNIVDSLLIAQFYVGVNPLDFYETMGDVNCDQDVDIVDALLIAQYYVGLVAPFSSCGGEPTAMPTPYVTNAPTAEPNNCYMPVQGQAVNHGIKLEGYGVGTTGGNGLNSVTVTNLSQLQSAIQSNRTIYVNGTISGSGMISVKDISNISIIGVGSNGRFQGCGLSFVRTSNIIVQNLTFVNASEDGINIEDTTAAWIDHNTFSTTVDWKSCKESSVKDQFDGQIDIKKNSANITVSYNYIHDACKAMLLGFSDGKEPDNYITYHHNRFENIGSRLPLIRHANTHVFNNYYKNILISGINVRMGANALIENNFFENVDDPILSADSDEIGYWNVSGNLYAPSGPTYTHNPEGADVIGEVVNCEVRSTTNWRMDYNYTLDSAVDVPATVIQYAGAGKM
ncbi:MAG: carbohydrate-binding protein [Spirochaetales bacterium]|nr:carbohydrate-binding protein [Spirochaetales bacterium]